MPRWADCGSPRKVSPVRKLPDLPGPVSNMVNLLKYNEVGDDLIDDVPEKEWRLLSTLARKRDRSAEREKLAVEFRKRWQKEKMERDYVSAKISEEYKHYLNRKREDENILRELRSCQLRNEQEQRQEYLIDAIRYKDKRSADILASCYDRKTTRQINKVLEDEARAFLAADRRCRLGAAEEWRRRAELTDELTKIDVARSRRTEHLRATVQRLAISNALSTWESELLKQETAAMDELRRAQHAAHAELTKLRGARFAHARDQRQERARRVAAFTAQLRDAVRMSRA